MATLDDLVARSVRDESTGCLRWVGAHTPKGYGQIVLDGKRVAVHRAAHELWIGPIPPGHEVDHVRARGCVYRDCIEPNHLESVTHAENVARQVATVTHCKHGHEYTPENTAVSRNGRGVLGRSCRTCKELRNKSRDRRSRG